MSIFSNKPKVAPIPSPASGSENAAPRVEKTDEEWRQELTPEEYRVLRQAGTERPYTGEYTDTHTAGVYNCRACGSRTVYEQ